MSGCLNAILEAYLAGLLKAPLKLANKRLPQQSAKDAHPCSL
jgi:hypothetical protein